MSGNKRKRSARSPSRRPNYRLNSSPPPEADVPLHARPLRIQAYEAELIHDRPNLTSLVESRSLNGSRSGLIPWGDQDIWLDRFDVRLLLDSAEEIATSDASRGTQSRVASDPLADVGWDDIPSDAEDTFFLTPEEATEYHHDKRRRMLEKGRQDRLRALAEEDEAQGDPVEASWCSDEEPDDAQANLMRRTAAHIRDSPNPTQLEMRILANHGGDPRFAFLRGRWKRAWVQMRKDKDTPINKQPKASMMGGLSAYATDSDESSGEMESGRGVAHAAEALAPISPGNDKIEEVKAARRARAKEWARKRREGDTVQE